MPLHSPLKLQSHYMKDTSKSITCSALPLRLLTADDCLVLTHLLWRPHRERIAQQIAALVRQYHPAWQRAEDTGTMPLVFAWARDHFDLRTLHVREEKRMAIRKDTLQAMMRDYHGFELSDEEFDLVRPELDSYLQEVEKLRTLDLADVLSARLLRAQEGEQH